MLETLVYTMRIDSTLTFLYFNLYLYSAYAGHYVYATSSNSFKYTKLSIFVFIYRYDLYLANYGYFIPKRKWRLSEVSGALSSGQYILSFCFSNVGKINYLS